MIRDILWISGKAFPLESYNTYIVESAQTVSCCKTKYNTQISFSSDVLRILTHNMHFLTNLSTQKCILLNLGSTCKYCACILNVGARRIGRVLPWPVHSLAWHGRNLELDAQHCKS